MALYIYSGMSLSPSLSTLDRQSNSRDLVPLPKRGVEVVGNRPTGTLLPGVVSTSHL